MDVHPKLGLVINDHTLSYKFFEALECISRTWSQRKAAKMLGVSHAVLNRRIKDAEEKLGVSLVEATGAGSELTDYAIKLLEKHRKYISRMKKRKKIVICGGYISSRLLEILALEYGLDVMMYSTDDESAIYLADMDMIDILTLDDPIHAFRRDLDFIPIAYDQLVLVSGNNSLPDALNDLKGRKFVEVINSSQRLAWNTLDKAGIGYRIVKQVKSPYTASKIVEDHNDCYTFLNGSFFSGSDIIKNETKHIISIVMVNEENKILKDFLEFILNEGQKIVEKSGFERIE